MFIFIRKTSPVLSIYNKHDFNWQKLASLTPDDAFSREIINVICSSEFIQFHIFTDLQ